MPARHLLLCVLAVGLVSITGHAQAPQGGQQFESMKGVVLKGLAPVSDNVLQVRLPPPREADLSNGIHLMVLEDHRLPEVALHIHIEGAGGYYAPAGTPPDLAAACLLLSLQGTTTRTAAAIARQQDTSTTLATEVGAASEAAILLVSSLADDFGATLDLAADLVMNPTFPAEEVARYKTSRKATQDMFYSLPTFLAREWFTRAVYGDHPAGRVRGRGVEVERITREALVAFHAAHYVPGNTTVNIIGDVTFDDALRKVEAALGRWKKAGVARPHVQEPDLPGPTTIHVVDRPNSVQTSLVIGTQAVAASSADHDAMQILNDVIGGGPMGRLFLNLREDKGWTYSARSALSAPTYRGTWSASAEVKAEVTDAAVREILKELDRLRTEPVPADELATKKRAAVARFALSLEDPVSILVKHFVSRRHNRPADYWDTYPARILAVTADEVQAAAQKYLDPSRLQIVAVGDAKRIVDGLRKLGTVVIHHADERRPEGQRGEDGRDARVRGAVRPIARAAVRREGAIGADMSLPDSGRER